MKGDLDLQIDMNIITAIVAFIPVVIYDTVYEIFIKGRNLYPATNKGVARKIFITADFMILLPAYFIWIYCDISIRWDGMSEEVQESIATLIAVTFIAFILLLVIDVTTIAYNIFCYKRLTYGRMPVLLNLQFLFGLSFFCAIALMQYFLKENYYVYISW